MFVQKANPYHDPKTGRFTRAPTSARAAASASTPYGSEYAPARFSILNEDGSLNVENASMLARELQKPGTPLAGSDVLLGRAYKAQGYDGKPHIVKDDEFQSLAGETYHRGDSKPEYSEQVRTGEYRTGVGMYGNGTYATKDAALAYQYAGGYPWEDPPGGVISFKMHPDARIPDKNILRNGIEPLGISSGKVVAGLDRAERDGTLRWDEISTLRNFLGDDGRLAIALGHDAYTVWWGEQDFIIVLNRTAMVISDRDVTSFRKDR